MAVLPQTAGGATWRVEFTFASIAGLTERLTAHAIRTHTEPNKERGKAVLAALLGTSWCLGASGKGGPAVT